MALKNLYKKLLTQRLKFFFGLAPIFATPINIASEITVLLIPLPLKFHPRVTKQKTPKLKNWKSPKNQKHPLFNVSKTLQTPKRLERRKKTIIVTNETTKQQRIVSHKKSLL